ncbi:hypothetical protein MOB54_02670 [Bacillus spizizenii]|nr:hypothetical protein [Bacillus spizizenii]
MAKLEGVKTLDMVNGEITKVAYDGAEYERVEGEAKAGDIALANKPGLDTTEGAYYAVTNPIDDGFIYRDNANESHYWNYDGTFAIFRKVAAGTNPSVEERVTKAEGEIESLKSDVAALNSAAGYKRIGKSEARVGDYVKFDDPPSYLTDKEYYAIVRLDHCGDPQVIDDDGDEFDTVGSDFEVYRKVSAASVEADPNPERLKVGDYAKVVEDQTTSDDDPIGDEACVGDYVEVLTVDRSDIPFEVRIIVGKHVGDTAWAREFALVRATDEEVAEAKRAAEFAKFKEGAKVRLLSGGGGYPLNGFENGGVYEVSDNNFDHKTGKLIRIEGGDCFRGAGFATPDQLEILSEEEAAEHKKWAEIGREVGEYKKGDIFRSPGGNLFEITRIDDSCSFPIIFTNLQGDYDGYKRDAAITLVTPVEARFDR